jgi:hypothetical protein
MTNKAKALATKKRLIQSSIIRILILFDPTIERHLPIAPTACL